MLFSWMMSYQKNTAHFEGRFSSSDSQPRSSRQDRTMNCDGHVWIGILGWVLQIIPDKFETWKNIFEYYVCKTWGPSNKNKLLPVEAVFHLSAKFKDHYPIFPPNHLPGISKAQSPPALELEQLLAWLTAAAPLAPGTVAPLAATSGC